MEEVEMEMSESLKRIEANQPREATWRYCSVCVEKGQEVVKLARALASAASNLRALDAPGDARAYERVLSEVAGGGDD